MGPATDSWSVTLCVYSNQLINEHLYTSGMFVKKMFRPGFLSIAQSPIYIVYIVAKKRAERRVLVEELTDG